MPQETFYNAILIPESVSDTLSYLVTFERLVFRLPATYNGIAIKGLSPCPPSAHLSGYSGEINSNDIFCKE